MLGFAALRDAAASLEGRDSSFFNEALGGFEAARERERLRAQGQFQNQVQALQAINEINRAIEFNRSLGVDPDPASLQLRDLLMQQAGFGAGGMPAPSAPAPYAPTPSTGGRPAVTPSTGVEIDPVTGAETPYDGTPEIVPASGPAPAAPAPATPSSGPASDLDAQEAAIYAQMRRRVAAGAQTRDLELQLAEIQRQREALAEAGVEQREEEISQEESRRRAFEVVQPRIDAALDFLISGYDDQGQPILNPMLTTMGGVRALETGNPAAYRQYVNALQTLGADTLIETLSRATFGSLSQEEMRVAMGYEGSLDPTDPYGVLQTLLQMRGNFERFAETPAAPQGNNTPTISWD